MTQISSTQLWVLANGSPNFDNIYTDYADAVLVAEKLSAVVYCGLTITYRVITLDEAIYEVRDRARFEGEYYGSL